VSHSTPSTATGRVDHPSGRWGIGLHYGATDRSMPVLELAVEAERRGFESMFLPEHTHIPTARTTPYPGGGEIPERYLRLWDPLVALTWVAAHTGMVVGTCVCLPGEHDPIAMAKAVATLDVLSEGRFVMGVGFGWNDEEFADHGHRPEHKHGVMLEKLAVMRAIWTADEAAFDGEHVHLAPSWSWPKPLQRPHPPVLLGGLATRTTFGRVARWADGWIPMSMQPHLTLGADLERLGEVCAELGRDPSDLAVMVMQHPLPADELAEVIATYRQLGVQRVLIDVPTATADVLLPLLDELAPAVERFAGPRAVR
jgi:probable F420-dependent oxidoreductase